MNQTRHILLATLVILFTSVACHKEDQDPPVDISPIEGDTEVFNLENPTVKSYLDMLEAIPYKDGDYTYSRIDDYYQLSTPYRKDHPFPATVSWEKTSGAVSQKVYVSPRQDLSDCMTFTTSGKSSSYDIFNLIPGQDYYWKVSATMDDGNCKDLCTGHFTTSGRTRFLKIDNICNVRDLGGIRIADGTKRIKYGLLFRGGEMNGYHQDFDNKYCRISTNGKNTMRQLGIAADLDMRTAKEAQSITTSPLGEDVDYIRFENANTYFYDKFWTTDEYVRAMQWTIDELRKGKPVFFHCIFGADRTGTFGFLIEALLGVGENEIAIDYELTSFSYGLEAPPRRRGPKNELSVYRYRQMLEGVLSSQFQGNTLQEKIRGFLMRGGISEADLDWFTDYMTEQIPS